MGLVFVIFFSVKVKNILVFLESWPGKISKR